MATVTISLPDPMADWVEQRIREGDYPDASDYFRTLVSRDKAEQGEEHLADDFPPQDDRQYTIEELQQIVAEARASGVSGKSVKDIIAEGDRIAKAGGFFRE